jgi:phage FluMu protein Com
MPEPICRICGQHFDDWGGLAQHLTTVKDIPHKRNKSGKLWAKKYIHRNAINKLKKIGAKKELEPRQPLTPEQLESKREAKYTLSGETKYVPVKCPRCKTGSRQFLEIEFVNSPEAHKVDDCYGKLCESCR